MRSVRKIFFLTLILGITAGGIALTSYFSPKAESATSVGPVQVIFENRKDSKRECYPENKIYFDGAITPVSYPTSKGTQIQLNASVGRKNFRLTGNSLFNLKMEDQRNGVNNCNPIISSPIINSPNSFMWNDWLYGFSRNKDTGKIYANIYYEYYGGKDKPDPPGFWYSAIGQAVSTDNGKTFNPIQSAPNHIIARQTFIYDGVHRGIGALGRIKSPIDGYDYQTFHDGAGHLGIMRTNNIDDPKSWKVWDGKEWSLSFYPSGLNNFGNLNTQMASLYYGWSTYYNKYISIGTIVAPTGIQYAFSLSDDMVNWGSPITIAPVGSDSISIPWGGYVSLVDPSQLANTNDSSASSGSIVGKEPYMVYITHPSSNTIRQKVVAQKLNFEAISVPPVTPPVTPPVVNNKPVGFIDPVNNGNIVGWSFDPDVSSTSNAVHLYIDGPAGVGKILSSVAANVPRPDVNNVYKISGNHGFSFAIPAEYKNGVAHTIHAYGIDLQDQNGNHNALLNNSPIRFTIAPPINNFTLSLAKTGNGSGSLTSNPSGINCGLTCATNFSKDSSVTLTASPSADSIFRGWSGACTGSVSSCTVQMNSGKTVSAEFKINQDPLGQLETIKTTNNKAEGWSFDPDATSTSNAIHFYIDGGAGQGKFEGAVVANKTRNDVNNLRKITGKHGFEFTIPSAYRDGKNHTLFAYAINLQNGNNPELIGSPKNFVLGTPTPALPVTATLTANGKIRNTIKTGEKLTYEWESKNAVSWSSSYTSTKNGGGTCGGSDSWIANSAKGSTVVRFQPSQANCTYNIRYKAVGASGMIVYADLVLNVVPNLEFPPPTATLKGNGSDDNVTLKAGEYITYTWSSKHGAIFSSSYTSKNIKTGASCGSSDSWVANSNAGTVTARARAEQANCIYTIKYKVVGAVGNAEDILKVTILPATVSVGSYLQTLSTLPARSVEIYQSTSGLLKTLQRSSVANFKDGLKSLAD